jgi:hypothetical protein
MWWLFVVFLLCFLSCFFVCAQCFLFPFLYRCGSDQGSGSSANASQNQGSAVKADDKKGDEEAPVAFKPFNMTGVWKRVKLDNYENFLAAQGASYVQRKLAMSISMTHTITMDDACTVIRLQEKGRVPWSFVLFRVF